MIISRALSAQSIQQQTQKKKQQQQQHDGHLINQKWRVQLAGLTSRRAGKL